MKGGRLHRPESLAPQTASAAPAPTPADDWVDGSWTVDCSCGVTFDDGEEMVSCDECNVWVHTRCARYVRGVHTSFSCHNCKSKRAPASADEAEVAELLAELPTHRPPPLYRRWAEVPLPARVHVHGLPAGSDASLFRGAPAFSAALWRCAGYVPKKFGFRYCEFPSWADDKEGADALFALAREKRKETPEPRFPLPLGGVQKKDKSYVRTLSSKKADGSRHAGKDPAEREPPPSEAKKRGSSASTTEADAYDAGCQQKGDLAVTDVRHDNQYTELNMASSDLHVLCEAKKIGESVELSGEKKSSEEITAMLKTNEHKESMRLDESSGNRTKTSVAEQEVHSLAKEEVRMYKQQREGNKNGHLQSGKMNSVVKMDIGKPSNGDVPIHAGPKKIHEGLDLQKQSNQAYSNLQVGGGVLNLQIGQSKSQNKSEATSDDHEKIEAIQSISDEHKSDKLSRGDTAGSSITQRKSSKLASNAVCSEYPKSEIQNQMHAVAENPNPNLDIAKVCAATSGSASTHFELSHSLRAEPSSAGKTVHLIKKEQTRLVSLADGRHVSAKHSEESSQELVMRYEKVPLKDTPSSTPKLSQASRTHMPLGKHKLPVLKEQTQKTAMTGDTPARVLHGEVVPSHSRNKPMPSSFSQKRDKTSHRFIQTTHDGSNNPASTELRSSDATTSLSDEQLALLLHQQLNSSPRVPRVPRCHQAASMQVLHPTGTTVFSKRSSAYGGREQTPLLKKRNKDDALRDKDDVKRRAKVSSVERRHRDSSTERVPYVKDSCRSTETIESGQKKHGICLTGATNGLVKDDPIDSSVLQNLPGLIDEIISKNRNISYGELCDAIRQHWRDLSKSGEDYGYANCVRAVNDCLRNRSEWAHLVDQGPKMNPNKRQKVERDSVLADVLETEKRDRAEKDPEDGSAESHQEDMARSKQYVRKRRRLELKGRKVKETRRSSIGSSSEDVAATLSDSSSDLNDESQEDNSVAPDTSGYVEPKSADSSS